MVKRNFHARTQKSVWGLRGETLHLPLTAFSAGIHFPDYDLIFVVGVGNSLPDLLVILEFIGDTGTFNGSTSDGI